MYKFLYFFVKPSKNYIKNENKVNLINIKINNKKIKHKNLKIKKNKKLYFFKVLKITKKETPDFYISVWGKKIMSYNFFNKSFLKKIEQTPKIAKIFALQKSNYINFFFLNKRFIFFFLKKFFNNFFFLKEEKKIFIKIYKEKKYIRFIKKFPTLKKKYRKKSL